jgi:hypothetical protein
MKGITPGLKTAAAKSSHLNLYILIWYIYDLNSCYYRSVRYELIDEAEHSYMYNCTYFALSPLISLLLFL